MGNEKIVFPIGEAIVWKQMHKPEQTEEKKYTRWVWELNFSPRNIYQHFLFYFDKPKNLTNSEILV